MDAVRRVADQRQPFGDDPRGMVEAERIARARAGADSAPRNPPIRLLRLGQEAAVAQLQHRRAASAASTVHTIAERCPIASSGSGSSANGPAG